MDLQFALMASQRASSDASFLQVSSGTTPNSLGNTSLRASLRILACKAWFLMACILALLFLFAGVLLELFFQQSTSYLTWWCLLSIIPLLTWTGKEIMDRLRNVIIEGCFHRTEIRSDLNPWDRNIIEAVIQKVRAGPSAPATHYIATIDADMGEEDAAGHDSSWRIAHLPEITQARLTIGTVDDPLPLFVRLTESEPFISGRNHERTRTATCELSIRIASTATFLWSAIAFYPRVIDCIAGKRNYACLTLHTWLQEVLVTYKAQKKHRIELFILCKQWADSNVTWSKCLERNCCSTTRRGLDFYAAQKWALDLKTFAKVSCSQGGKSTACIFLHGSKGSGKTIFVEWLAGELRCPIYYIDLSSKDLDDSQLRLLTSRNSLNHSPPVIFYFDETQKLFRDWVEKASTSVTIRGLQTVLEGTTTMSNCIFLLSSSNPLPRDTGDVADEFAGLYRRFHRIQQIPKVRVQDAQDYFIGFLSGYFAPENVVSTSLWNDFLSAWNINSPDSRVCFDMFYKYAECFCRDFDLESLCIQRGLVQQNQASPAADASGLLTTFLFGARVHKFIEEYHAHGTVPDDVGNEL